jgi:hypothetical protein
MIQVDTYYMAMTSQVEAPTGTRVCLFEGAVTAELERPLFGVNVNIKRGFY